MGMARLIEDTLRTEERQFTSLATLDQVSVEELRKKYMEQIDNGILPTDERSIGEIQNSEAAAETDFFLEFFELKDEVTVDPDEPMESAKQISIMIEEGSKEVFEKAEEQRANNIEEDEAEKIKQLTAFTVNDDDPLLTKEYTEKKEKLIQSIRLEEEKTQQKTQSDSFYDRQENRSQTREQARGFTHSASSSRTASGTSQTIFETNEPTQQYRAQMVHGSKTMKDLAVNGAIKKRKEHRPKPHSFGGKRKFRFKNVVKTVRDWFRTDDARVMTKVGIALCFETAIAVICGKYEFDGPTQTLGYLAMMMGVFYISRELLSEGYDPRRMNLI